MADPLVSICLPNLNSREFIEERMTSILDQTLSDWELIVCDSNSDDESWEIIQKFEADPRIKLYQVPREGIYAGWNECLKRAEGKYISIAPSDDTARPEFLETMVGALEAYTDVDLAVCQFDFVDSDGNVFDPPPKRRFDLLYEDWIVAPHRRPRQADILTHLCVGIPWTTTTALVFRRSILARTGLFRTDCGARADGLWSLRASLHTDSISMPQRMATWRRHERQGSRCWESGWWRQSCHLIDELLAECKELIPESWRSDTQWREELLAIQRTRYLRSLGVDRKTAVSFFPRFVLNCAKALLQEPRFTLRRLCRGLPWEDPELKDEYTHVDYLISKWNVDWRPTPLDGAM